MSMVVGLAFGAACSLIAILVGRRLATALMVAPVIGWFVFLGVGIHAGLTSDRTTQLALGLLGVLLGLAVGQVFDTRDRSRRPRR